MESTRKQRWRLRRQRRVRNRTPQSGDQCLALPRPPAWQGPGAHPPSCRSRQQFSLPRLPGLGRSQALPSEPGGPHRTWATPQLPAGCHSQRETSFSSDQRISTLEQASREVGKLSLRCAQRRKHSASCTQGTEWGSRGAGGEEKVCPRQGAKPLPRSLLQLPPAGHPPGLQEYM